MSEYFESLLSDSNNKQTTVSTTQTDLLNDKSLIITFEPHQLLQLNLFHEKEKILILALLLFSLVCLLISFILIIRLCCGLKQINYKIKSMITNATNLQNNYSYIDRETRTIKRFCVATLKVNIEGTRSKIKNFQKAVFYSNSGKVNLNIVTNETSKAVSKNPEELVCFQKLDSLILNLEDAISINPFL
jgi:hypothetical protein